MKVAILGAAHPHVNYVLEELRHRPGLQLVGAAEPDPSMRHQFLGGLEDIPVIDDIAQLAESVDFDVALVAGVYSQRAAAVAAALRAGAHVIADKPLCTNLDDLAGIERLATSQGRHVSVVFEKRFYPATLALRKVIDRGVLGDIALVASTGPHKLRQAERPAWFLDSARYGGIAGDLPVHDIDLVLSMTSAESGTVSAQTGNAREAEHPGFDDHVALLLRSGHALATIEANWLGPEASEVHGHYRMRVTGSEATAELDWTYHGLRITSHTRASWEEPLPEPVRPARYFFDAIERGTEPEITTAQTILASRIALLAQRSAAHGGMPEHWAR